MSVGILAGGTNGSLIGAKTEVTTTRVRDDITTTLTNIDTKSDAWGKVIPMGFGRHRVAGALVWASQFYKTTESFDDVTTTKSTATFSSVSIGDDAVARGGSIFDVIVNTPQDVVYRSGSQVTHGTEENSYIDLCYSFGTDGDVRKKRYIEKIRINDLIVYDVSASPPYIADGLGFSIRYGYDNAPPALLAQYPNGKFHYKGQTLVIFDKFPLSKFGDNVPDSVDVEFGCCVGAQPAGCGFAGIPTFGFGPNRGAIPANGGVAGYGGYQVGDIVVVCHMQMAGHNQSPWLGSNLWTKAGSYGNTFGTLDVYYFVVTAENLASVSAADIVCFNSDDAQHSPADVYWIASGVILPSHRVYGGTNPFYRLEIGDLGFAAGNVNGHFDRPSQPQAGSVITHAMGYGFAGGLSNPDQGGGFLQGGGPYFYAGFANKPTFGRDAPDGIDLPPFSINKMAGMLGVLVQVGFVECPEIG